VYILNKSIQLSDCSLIHIAHIEELIRRTAYCSLGSKYSLRIVAQDRRDERDRKVGVRSSRLSELRTPTFNLRIATVARGAPVSHLREVLVAGVCYFVSPGTKATSVTMFSSSTKSTAAAPLDNVASLG
jgi:hypothetical protein